MSGWFTKSQQTRTTNLADEPQPYDVTCQCGQMLSGVRQRQHQIVYCAECGVEVFVLPADAYPPIEGPKSKSRKRKRRKRARRPTVIDTPETNLVEPDVRTSDPPVAEVKEETPPLPALLAPERTAKNFVTPFRAVVVLAVLIVSLTVWWGLHLRSLDAAAQAYQSERQAGDEALARGELSTAAEHFQQACDAVETLGRTDAAALETCQLAKETQAAAHLAVYPLMTIIEGVHQSLLSAKTDEERLSVVSQAFDLYAGQWIVIDANMYTVGGEGEHVRWLLEFPLMLDGTRVEIAADLPVLAPYQSHTRSQRRVIIAAQFDKCRMQGKSLVVELVPETAFLWHNANTLTMIGLLPGDDDKEQQSTTLALLKQQTRISEPAR